MKRSFIFIALYFVAMSVMAQPRFNFAPQIIKLWENGNPEKEYVALPSEFQKKNLPADYMEPKLEIYKAMKPNGLCILECPGGGYTMLSDSHEGRNMAQWFNSLGITYCVLEYRMPFGFSDVPLHDAEQAMKIIRANAEEWGINKIGVMGCSAGGHLASTLATHYSSAETCPDFQILLYPVITMDKSYTHMGTFNNLLGPHPNQEIIDKYSNEKHVSKHTPPAILILSADDNVVNPKNSIEYYYALRKAGVSASLHIYPIGGHGYGNSEWNTYKRQWTDEVEKWLTQFQ